MASSPAGPTRATGAAGQDLLDRVREQVAEVETRLVSGLNAREAKEFRRYVTLCHAALADKPPH